jgi:excinuclease ABC subunit A
MATLTLRGARVHTLQSLDLDIPLQSLVVLTGPSGSGKSSLAFDTIFAEGQRRLVELLSPASRRLADALPRPDFDVLEGLLPTLACEQSAPRWGAYSTVGTAIDVAHGLALLFLRCGVLHCPRCGEEQGATTVPQMVDRIMTLPERARFVVCVDLPERGETLALRMEDLRRDGFTRLQIDSEVVELAELEGALVADEVLLQVDRLVRKEGIESRLADSLELALRLGGGRVLIDVLDQERISLSSGGVCHQCSEELPLLSTSLLSFRTAAGRCIDCGGLGQRAAIDVATLVPDQALSLRDGAVAPWHDKNPGFYRGLLETLCKDAGIDVDAPWSSLSKSARELVLYGKVESNFKGVVFDMEKRLAGVREPSAKGDDMMSWLRPYLVMQPCNSCGGSRMSEQARSVRLAGMSMAEVHATPLAEVPLLLRKFEAEAEMQGSLVTRLTGEIEGRLRVADDLGLSYLPVGRSTSQLSSGEARRLRLVELLSTGLSNVLFVLDEPTAGLHAEDSQRVLALLRRSLDAGNSLLLVEHDPLIIESADAVIDMGPGAGRLGGQVVAQASGKELGAIESSVTGAYLSGRKRVELEHESRPQASESLRLRGACANNLKSVDLELPLGRLSCIAGVSAAGKSSLLMHSLLPALKGVDSKTYSSLESDREIERCFEVSTEGIQRSPRSTPATYTGLALVIRDLYAKLPESRARGFTKTRFSTNVRGGRCTACKGEGYLRVDQELFADTYLPCTVCLGKRFDRQTLQVRFRGLDIASLYEMTVDEACSELAAIPKAMARLQALQRVGLGYLQLGQPSTSLSGGELQRLVLAKELAKTSEQHCVYLIDEPSLGLHWCDLQVLLHALDALVEDGHTVVVCDHNLDLMRVCDYLVELGPGPGEAGGRIIAAGTPKELSTFDTPTGRALLG